MPYINVKLTEPGVTAAHKAEIVRRFTDTLVEVLGEKPEHIHIVLDLVDEENWGYAGMLTTEFRRQDDDHGKQ